MILGIMQPYFFPYLGYFSLIKHTDQFILFDTPQFIYHGWIERNRILKQTAGWQYIAVPLQKHGHKDTIQQIHVDNTQDWQKKILAQLVHYRKAPYYWPVIQILQSVFKSSYSDITHLDLACLSAVCDYLEIPAKLTIYSEMGLKIGPVAAPDEWALRICQSLPGTTEYWNPPGGIEFFDRNKYVRNGIKICFQKMILDEYPQKGEPFEPGLSILDVMMFNTPDQINNMLDHYTLF